MKFYHCKACGNIIIMLENSGVKPVCCGKEMEELVPKTVDEAKEKHVPVISCKEDGAVEVTIGEQLHPMTDEHYIKWIVLETDKGKYIKNLKPGVDPIARFTLCKSEIPITAYEFCNIHSLWGKTYEEENGC